MARSLVFQFAGQELAFSMSKLDRAKLYGFKEVQVLDEEGNQCEMATLGQDGATLIGKGGTAMVYLSQDGNWCERSELTPVDADGKPITPVESSFNAPVPLLEEATCEEYLNHQIKAVYHLTADDGELDANLKGKLAEGTIFRFPYSYRGGLVADTGFLLMGNENAVFLLVAEPCVLEMVSLQQTGASTEEAESETEDEADLMDFDMI